MNKTEWLHGKIAEAVQQKLAEQDIYCTTITNFQKIEATAEHRHKLVTLGWEGLLKLMENECFPPNDDDWTRWLHIKRDNIPFNTSLAKIADISIRGSTGILQGTSDQALRQRAIAKFLTIVGGFSPDTYQVFNFWSQWSAVQMILKEYVTCGMSSIHGLEILNATVSAYHMLGEKTLEELYDGATGHQALHATTSLRTSA